MEKNWKLLVIDDNQDILVSLRLLLKPYVEVMHVNTDPQEIPKFLKNTEYDAVLLDMNFTKDAISGSEGFHWLGRILELSPGAVVIFITAYGDTEKAVKAIRAGATDFVTKPWDNNKLVATISSAVELKRSKQKNLSLRTKQDALNTQIDTQFVDFLGESAPMKQVFTTIAKVAPTDANMLIVGENGTGKELVARALHRQSARNGEVFINVDMGSLNENLFESELFGHVKGAFTDAKADKAGRFEVASGGTIFLDEIGNLSLPMQAKLLTVLERREVVRVGSNKSIPVDIRLICATNVNLAQQVANGQFRQDLFYRVNTVQIHVPPLRERGSDIELLSKFYIDKYARKYKKNVVDLSASCLRQFLAYPWPGNVRELQHCVERAVIMCDSSMLTEHDCMLQIQSLSTSLVSESVSTLNLDELERLAIEAAMKKHAGNLSKVAKELGLTRASLYRRLEKYGI